MRSILRRTSQAFTMIEIMIVVTIIGVILAFALPKMGQWFGTVTETKIKLKMVGIQGALQSYFMELGTFPSSKDGLRALLENPRKSDDRYRKVEAAGKWPFIAGDYEAICDADGREFVYNSPPQKFKNKYKNYELIWFGKSGEEGAPDTQEMGG